MTDTRVLAVDPMRRGFGFVVFEGLRLLVDWGTREARTDKNERSLERLDELIGEYAPEALVVEDWEANGSRRCERVEALLEQAVERAEAQDVATRRVAPRAVKTAFENFIGGYGTKHQIARAVAEVYPPLRPQLPPKRELFDSETERMAIFDAAALALTHFHTRARETELAA